MNLIEFFSGTIEEQKAAITEQSLTTLSRKRELNPNQQQRLDAAQAARGRLSRRRWGTLALAATAGAGLTVLGITHEKKVKDGFEAIGIDIKSDEDHLEDAATRLGIYESETEKALWASARFTPYDRKYFNQRGINIPALEDEALERANIVIDALMPQSENPYLVNAAAFIATQQAAENLVVNPFSQYLRAGQPRFTMAVQRILFKDRLAFGLSTTTELILASKPDELALQFAHEAKHAEVWLKMFNDLPKDLPAETRFLLLNNEIRSTWSYQESLAYGNQFQALTHQFGLTRQIYPGARSAVRLNKCGQVESDCWKKYTTETLVIPF